MVICDNANKTIQYHHKGREGEYILHLNAMVIALGAIEGNSEQECEARRTLTTMLLKMLPTEQQIRL